MVTSFQQNKGYSKLIQSCVRLTFAVIWFFIYFYLSAIARRREICRMSWDTGNLLKCSQNLHLWNQVIYHQPKDLPTTMHLQVVQLMNLDLRCLDPTKCWWKFEKSCQVPIKTDINPTPEFLLNFIRWKCKITTKNPCGTTHWPYRNHDLKSVAACGDRQGKTV